MVSSTLATLSLAPPLAAQPAGSTTAEQQQQPDSEDGTLNAIIEPVSGVRTDAPTIIGGVVLNGSDTDEDVTVRVRTPDVRIATARPSQLLPDDGMAWNCTDAECRLVDDAGKDGRLEAGGGVQLMLLLSGPGLTNGSSVEVTVGDLDPIHVPVDRPDGQAPIGREAIGLVGFAAETITAGFEASSELVVTNLGASALDDGSLSVQAGAPAAEGATVQAVGESWSCDPNARCTYRGSLAPLDSAPPIAVTTLVPPRGTEEIAAAAVSLASASAGGVPLVASTETGYTVRPAAGSGVGVVSGLDQPSISAPNSQSLVGTVLAHGSAPYAGAVTLSVEVPDEAISIDWAEASPVEAWACDAEAETCTATGPIDTETPTLIELPMTVSADIEPGLYDLVLKADLPERRPTKDEAATRSSTSTLVVNPPPAPELRSALVPAASLEAHDGPITLDSGGPGLVDVLVVNQGTRPARSGSTVVVELTADEERPAPALATSDPAAQRWSCDAEGDVVDDTRPLTCSTRLVEPIEAGASARVPLALDTADPGSTTWTVVSGAGDELPRSTAHSTSVLINGSSALLVPTAQVTSKIVRGGSGELEIRTENRGTTAADGAVVVIDLPADLTLKEERGDTWTCVHAGFARARGTATCATDAPIGPGTSSPPLSLEVSADTDADQTSIWLWATTGDQQHPKSKRSGRHVEIDLRGSVDVTAGEPMTVVTPVLDQSGEWRPATVRLHGDVDVTSRADLTWTQVDDGPRVEWIGTEPGADPTGDTAVFIAPEGITESVTFRFRLSARHGSDAVSDTVDVTLEPAAIRAGLDEELSDSSAPTPNDAEGEGASGPSTRAPEGVPAATSARPGRWSDMTTPAEPRTCVAVRQLADGSDATIVAGAIAVAVPAASNAEAARAVGECSDATAIEVTGASVLLPDGITVADAAGVLGPDGLVVSSGSLVTSKPLPVLPPRSAVAGLIDLSESGPSASLATEPVQWSPNRYLSFDAIRASITATCTSSVDTTCSASIGLGADASARRLGAIAPSPAEGSIDPATGALKLAATFDAFTVAPLTIQSPTVEVTAHPTATGVTVDGSSLLLGVEREVSLTFTENSVQAIAQLDTMELASGWTLDDAVAVATDVAGVYTPTDVPVLPGLLNGIATFEIPEALRSPALSDEVSSGDALFDLTSSARTGAAPDLFRLEVRDPKDTYLAGTSTSPASVQLNRLVYDVRPAGGSTTVGLSGAAMLRLAGGRDTPLSLSGSLTITDRGPAMSVEARQAGTGGALPLGPAGAPVAGVNVRIDAGDSVRATLSATMTIPDRLAVPLGLPAGATAPITGTFDAGNVCVTAALDAGHRLDIARAGLIVPSTAVLAWTPTGCTAGGRTISAGLSMLLDDGGLGQLSIPLDPATLEGTGTTKVGRLNIGGVNLHDSVLTVAVGGGAATITVEAVARVDAGEIPVRGTVEPGANGPGRLHLRGALPRFVLGDRLVLTNLDLAIDTTAVLDLGTPAVTITATADVLDHAVPIELRGQASGGSIAVLDGTINRRVYKLPKGDSVETAWTVQFDRARAEPLQVRSTVFDAKLTIDQRKFTRATVELQAKQILIRTLAEVPGRLGVPVDFVGKYAVDSTGSEQPGDYSLGTAESISVDFVGFQAPATVTFERSRSKASSNMRATLSLGMFDSDKPVVVSGPVASNGTATLTGSVDNVAVRGVGGTATVTVLPDPAAPGSHYVKIALQAKTTNCNLWRKDPLLEGIAFRADGATVYEMKGDVTLNLPNDFASVVPNGVKTQPLELSSETGVPSGNNVPAAGLTVEFGIKSAVFSVIASASFNMLKCAFTLSGEATLQFDAGKFAAALGQNLKPVGGAKLDLKDVLGGTVGKRFDPNQQRNMLMPDLAKRARKRFDEAQQAKVAEAERVVAVHRRDLEEARNVADLAEINRSESMRELTELKRQKSDAPPTGRKGADPQVTAATTKSRASDTAAAESRLRLARSEAAHADAAARADMATAIHNETATRVNEAERDVALAKGQIDARKKQDKIDERTKKLVTLKLSWTRCERCTDRDVIEVRGSLNFAVFYTVGISLTAGIKNDALSMVGGSISFGIDANIPPLDAGPLKVVAYAGASITGSLEYRIGQGWSKLAFVLEGRAGADVVVNLWLTKLTGSLVGISVSGTLTIIPELSISGEFEVVIWSWKQPASFGPVYLKGSPK